MSAERYEYRVVDADGEACYADVFTDEAVEHTRCLVDDDPLSCPAADVAANEARVYSNGDPDCGPHRVQRRLIGAWEELPARASGGQE